MKEKGMEERINEVCLLASERPNEKGWGKICDITKGMNLEELNKLDEAIVLKDVDFGEDPPSTFLVATVSKINWQKIDLLIEEMSRKANDFNFGLNLSQLLGKCFFRAWTLRMAVSRFEDKAKEIEKKPEVLPEIKAILFLAAAEIYMKLAEDDYRSST